jgi:hypothetical protein
VSTSAGGAVSSTSITGINSHFVNPGTPRRAASPR